MRRTKRIVFALAVLGLTEAPASARILKTRSGVAKADVLIGAGFELETAPDGSEYGVPVVLEYAPVPRFKIGIEPTMVIVDDPDAPPVAGFGELEEAVTFELVTERRVRPSISLEQVAKLPTALPADL